MNVSSHRTRVFIHAPRDTKVLVMLRHFGNDDVLLLPGGGVDEGETAEAALLREVEEEIGIDLLDLKMVYQWTGTSKVTGHLLHYYPSGSTVTNNFDFFTASTGTNKLPKLKEPEKFSRIDWVEPNKIVAYAKQHHAKVGDGILEALNALGFFTKAHASAW